MKTVLVIRLPSYFNLMSIFKIDCTIMLIIIIIIIIIRIRVRIIKIVMDVDIAQSLNEIYSAYYYIMSALF